MPVIKNTKVSEPLSEIMEAVPKWYVRFGLTVVFLIVIVAILLMCFYKLPKKVSFPVSIAPKVAKFRFILNDDTRIDTIYPNPGTKVRENDPLLTIVALDGSANTIESPIDGIFSILKVSQSTTVSVTPNDSSLVVSALLGQSDTTKFFSGQEVKIYLDEFPEKSFGYLKCTSYELPQMQTNNKFQFTLNCSFVTTKNIRVQIDSAMKGHAAVFSSHKTIFESLFGNLLKK